MDNSNLSAEQRNFRKNLYCTECCTDFELQRNGAWKSGSKVATKDNNNSLNCTCGTLIGITAKNSIEVGETVVPNENEGLRCKRCSSIFTNANGNWKSENKIADIVQGRLIVCCDTEVMGVIAQNSFIKDEVVPVN
ncbi:hypothetical protein ACFL2R_02260 [Patescibacteria group bacterium]